MKTKEAYIQKIEADLELTQAKLAEARIRTQSSATDAQTIYAEQIDKLEKKATATKARLGELTETHDDALGQFMDGVGIAWSAVRGAVRNSIDKGNT